MTAFESIQQSLATVIRPCRLAALAVFVLCGLATTDANASCGDWLAGHDDSSHAVADASRNPTPDMPCHGPSCQRNRQDLPIVPPAPSRQMDRAERWFWLSEALAAQPPLSSTLPLEATPATLDGFGLSIDRPPRV